MSIPEKVVQIPSSGGALKAQRIGDKFVSYDPALGLFASYPNYRVGGIYDSNRLVHPLYPVNKSAGGIFCNWQSSTGTLSMVSTDANDDVALDSSVTLDGYSCVKCTFSDAASGTYIAQFAFTNPVSLKSFKTLHVPVKITQVLTASGVGLSTAAFQIWLTLSSGKTVRLQCNFDNIPPGGWHVFTFSRYSTTGGQIVYGGGAVIGDLDSETVTNVRIVQASVTGSNAAPVWVGPLRVNARAVGHVSIVMDGCYASQYSILKPILDLYDFKTSLAVVNSFLGSSSSYMDANNVSQMYAEGHECIHHTYDGTKQNGYVNASDWSTSAAIAADIHQQWDYFRTMGWERGIGKAVNAFANTFLPATAVARQNLVLDAFRMAGVECARASVNLYTEQMQLGYVPPNPLHLRGAIQITNTDTAAGVQAIIDQAESDGTWAIITVHRAVDSSPGSLEMTTDNFTTWIRYLASRVATGNIVVAPMGQVFDTFYRA
jgi:hypothetical protein